MRVRGGCRSTGVRTLRTRRSWLGAGLVLAVLLLPLAGDVSRAAAWSFPNQEIVTQAMSYPINSNQGTCKEFATTVVNAVLAANGILARVGGYGSPGGCYYGSYQNAGGTLIGEWGPTDGAGSQAAIQNAVPGDLIQAIPDGYQNSDYPPTTGLHTAIVIAVNSPGDYQVRDSNWAGNDEVEQHDWNLNSIPSESYWRGSTVYVWRFGTVAPATRIGMLDSNGALYVKEGALDAGWVHEFDTVSSFQLDGDRIAALTGKTLWVKEGLNGSWVDEYTDAKAYQISGDYIGMLDSNGALYVKEGALDAGWVHEFDTVSSFQLDGDRIAALTGKTLWVKEGLNGSWVDEYTDAKAYQISGDYIGMLDSNGALYVKEGALDAGWVHEFDTVSSFQLDGDRIAALTGKTLWVKEGLNGSWVDEYTDAKAYQISGDYIGMLDSNGALYVKEGALDAGWVHEFDTVSSFQLDGDRIAALTGKTLWVKEGLNGSWVDEYTDTIAYQLSTRVPGPVFVADTTSPTTTVSGADGRWHNTPVTLTLHASDNSGGSGVAATYYKVDSGAWTQGTSVTITAPADHTNDGAHTVRYYSTDLAGNSEAARSVTVKIDTCGPATAARQPAAVAATPSPCATASATP